MSKVIEPRANTEFEIGRRASGGLEPFEYLNDSGATSCASRNARRCASPIIPSAAGLITRELVDRLDVEAPVAAIVKCESWTDLLIYILLMLVSFGYT